MLSVLLCFILSVVSQNIIHLDVARALLRDGDCKGASDAALTVADVAFEADDEVGHVNALRLAEKAMRQCGFHKRRASIFEELIALDPNAVAHRVSYIHVLRKINRTQEAAEAVKVAVRRHPGDPTVLQAQHCMQIDLAGEHNVLCEEWKNR